MFPDGYKDEVQVMTHVLQYDGVNNPDVMAMIAAFAAIRISGFALRQHPGCCAHRAHQRGALRLALR